MTTPTPLPGSDPMSLLLAEEVVIKTTRQPYSNPRQSTYPSNTTEHLFQKKALNKFSVGKEENSFTMFKPAFYTSKMLMSPCKKKVHAVDFP